MGMAYITREAQERYLAKKKRDDDARGARDACLTISRMELDEVYQKARKESRLDAMVDLNEVKNRVEKRIDAMNAEAVRP